MLGLMNWDICGRKMCHTGHMNALGAEVYSKVSDDRIFENCGRASRRSMIYSIYHAERVSHGNNFPALKFGL